MLYVFDTGIISLTDRCLTWKIYNFFTLPLVVGCEIRSPQFVYGNCRYSLYIWPRGRKGCGTEEWFGICLHKYGERGTKDTVQFSIVGAKGNIKTCTVECSENNIFMQERFLEWSDFRVLSRQVAPNGCLTIVCKLPMENRPRSLTENDANSKVYNMDDRQIKKESQDYYSSEPFVIIPTYKSPPDASRELPSYVPSSTVNPFYSSPLFENSFEHISTSPQIESSDFTTPDSSDSTPENTFWSNLTSDFSRSREENKPETMPDSVQDVPVQNSEVTPDSAITTSTHTSKPEKTFLGSVLEVFYPKIETGIEVEVPNANESESSVSSDSNPGGNLMQSEEASTPATSCPIGLLKLSQCFKNLYLEGKEHDLTIKMEDKEFKVLKGILKARSPVFAKLLSENTDGNTSSTITIDPFGACDTSAFHDFLLYIYSGDIKNLSEKNICGVYCAASKFELPELKEDCMKFLNMTLSIDTITRIFRSIDKESELVDKAVVFLAKNMEVVMNTDEWKQYMREEPEKAVEFHLKALKIGYKKTIV